jgi:ATP-binding cassette subfamily C protein
MSDSVLSGIAELREQRRKLFGLFAVAFVFSLFVNLLTLTGPLFMLQTYDRVLSSRSEPTLLALFMLMGFLFLIMGLIDWARGRLLTRMGARFQAGLDRRVFEAMLRRSVSEHRIDENTGSGQQLKDLEAMNRFFASPVFSALFDVPWTPIFILGLGFFHPWMGGLAAVGGGILLGSALLNQMSSRATTVKSSVAGHLADQYADQMTNEAETIRSLGMQGHAFERWAIARKRAVELAVKSSDTGGSFATFSRIFRLFLQSAMLALGALLVLRGEISGGMMIASSILMARALQPVETIINQWPMVQRSKRAWDNLASLLAEMQTDKEPLQLPHPKARIEVNAISVTPPKGRVPVLRQVSFTIAPGEAIGVIGPSGSGKSTLARALTGVWPLTAGKIKLDGAPLEQYPPEVLALYIGYLPQRVTLFDGTVAENIARLAREFSHEAVIAAAQKAAAHEMILRLPQGYNTPVHTIGTQLSGGQIQRVGLARALYSNPVLLVLDEPNSNLDNEGSLALNQAIVAMKEAGNAVLIMAHRPSAIKECDKLLVLEDGQRKAWGPREAVMSEMLANVHVIRKTLAGGVS